jgi:hypothetical protein
LVRKSCKRKAKEIINSNFRILKGNEGKLKKIPKIAGIYRFNEQSLT